ncbi:MAG TPA: flagellar basal body P-ring formation chaperone FlgA [Steroidobacteraceae bacterium]|nr:flagellar basal body P-ring formation chaperone FlgA [Steroidobacteraceae bacterium]
MSTFLMSGFRRRRLAAGLALIGAALTAGAVAAEPAEAPGEPLAAVRAAAVGLIRSQLRGVTYEVHVDAQLDPRLHLARCPDPLATSLPSGAELGAHVAVRVSCPAPGFPWAVYVPVNIESDIRVLVLKQSALRGARLNAAQVTEETRRVAGLAIGYVSDVATLERHTLARPLPAGTALTADAMLADLIVRQGQEVTLIASAPGVSVRATGKALQDGREGARVRVQNLASLKVVEGVVDASGVIEITP